jgi:hypothetical protein
MGSFTSRHPFAESAKSGATRKPENFVILSGGKASLREASPESKDPAAANFGRVMSGSSLIGV